VPARLVSGIGLGRTTVSLAVNNVMWWDNCHCTDPNSTWGGADSFGVNESVLTDPSPRTVRLFIATRF
jgi:hypothetical protein